MGIDTDHESRHPHLKHVSAPERPAGSMSTPTPEAGRSPEKKSRKGLIIGVTSGIAGATLAAGAVMGLNAANQAEAPSTQPTAEAPADPSEPSPEAPASAELTVEQVEIQAGLSAEQVGQTIIERFDDWQNAGTNDPAIWNEWRSMPLEMTTGEFVVGKAEAFGAVYAQALYVDGWEAQEDLVRNYDFGVRTNANTLEMNLKTSNPTDNPEDLQGFQRNIKFESAREVSIGDGTRVIEIDFSESNNADQNRAGEAFGPETATFGQPTGRFTMTLVTVNGVERIAQTAVSER